MFTVSYLQCPLCDIHSGGVFLCYNRRWLGLASLSPRYSCNNHLYLLNGLTLKNSVQCYVYSCAIVMGTIPHWTDLNSCKRHWRYSAVFFMLHLSDLVLYGTSKAQWHVWWGRIFFGMTRSEVEPEVEGGAFGAVVRLFQHSCIPCCAAVSMLGEIRWNWLENPITTSLTYSHSFPNLHSLSTKSHLANFMHLVSQQVVNRSTL